MEFSMCHIHNIIKDRLFFLDSFLKEQSLPVIKLNVNYHDFSVAPFFFNILLQCLILRSILVMVGPVLNFFYVKAIQRALFTIRKHH